MENNNQDQTFRTIAGNDTRDPQRNIYGTSTAVKPGQLLAAVELNIDEDKLSNALLKRVEQLRQIKALQNASTNSSDEYMVGLFNGLSLALATMENKEPVFMATQTKQCNCNKDKQLIQSILSLFSNDDLHEQINKRLILQREQEMPTPMQENKTEYFG